MGTDPVEATGAYIARHGVAARPLRDVIAALADPAAEPAPVDELVPRFALSRRTVEGLLDALDDDLQHTDKGVVICPERAKAYRERFATSSLSTPATRTGATGPVRDVGGLDSPRVDAPGTRLVADTRRLVETAPAPLPRLDHVPATPETVARRATWLDSTYDLTGAHLLCVGDHDLTSLAACLVNPGLSVTVVDLDERVLEFIDDEASRRGLPVRCLYGDLRHDLPLPAASSAELVFTDPPYTPEGVGLFLARGLRGIRDRDNARLVVAYGFGENHPALGLKAQREMQRLHLAFEAILPGFNRYHGAQAIGGASDLYVCRPTARTWKALDRALDRPEQAAKAGGSAIHVYTRGAQSLEGSRAAVTAGDARTATAVAAGKEALPVSLVIGEAWPHAAGVVRVPLARMLTTGAPRHARGQAATIADLTADPGPWLLRLLLAADAARLAVLVPRDHPDLAAIRHGREGNIGEIVRAKYALSAHNDVTESGHAVLEAVRIERARLSPQQRPARWMLDRAHGKVANTWREALIHLSGEVPAESRPAGESPVGTAEPTERAQNPLTKNQARAVIRATTRRRDVLDARPIDLPRHQLRDLLADVAESLRQPGPGNRPNSSRGT